MFLLVDLQMYLGNFTLRLFRSPLVFRTTLTTNVNMDAPAKTKLWTTLPVSELKGMSKDINLQFVKYQTTRINFPA